MDVDEFLNKAHILRLCSILNRKIKSDQQVLLYCEGNFVIMCPPERHCEGRVDGTYPHPSLCHSYILCSNGRTYQEACPQNLIYSPALGGCDFDLEGRCYSGNV